MINTYLPLKLVKTYLLCTFCLSLSKEYKDVHLQEDTPINFNLDIESEKVQSKLQEDKLPVVTNSNSSHVIAFTILIMLAPLLLKKINSNKDTVTVLNLILCFIVAVTVIATVILIFDSSQEEEQEEEQEGVPNFGKPFSNQSMEYKEFKRQFSKRCLETSNTRHKISELQQSCVKLLSARAFFTAKAEEDKRIDKARKDREKLFFDKSFMPNESVDSFLSTQKKAQREEAEIYEEHAQQAKKSIISIGTIKQKNLFKQKNLSMSDKFNMTSIQNTLEYTLRVLQDELDMGHDHESPKSYKDSEIYAKKAKEPTFCLNDKRAAESYISDMQVNFLQKPLSIVQEP
jgi:hypothetical protein